jgi:predicted transcriptional regulator
MSDETNKPKSRISIRLCPKTDALLSDLVEQTKRTRTSLIEESLERVLPIIKRRTQKPSTN